MSNHLFSKLLTSSQATALVARLEDASEITSKMDNDTFKDFQLIANNFYDKYKQITDVIVSISHYLTVQKNVTDEIFSKMSDAYSTKERIYRYQDYSIEKNFLRGREAMEERTLSNVANAFAEFAMVNTRRILRLATDNETGDALRFELYKLVIDDLIVRQEIVEKARANITLLIKSFITGTPIFNYKFEDIPRAHNTYIVPKPLMNYSMHHNHYMKKFVPKLNSSDFKLLYSVLDMFMEQATIAYENRTVNETELNYVFERFQFACRTYMYSKSVVYTQGIELPTRVIQERLSDFRNEWSLFDDEIVDMQQNMKALTDSLENITINIIPEINKLIVRIKNYTENSNGRLMVLADAFLSNETKLLTNIIKDFFQEIQTRGQQIKDIVNILLNPVKTMWTMIINDDDSFDYYDYTNNTLFQRNLSFVLKEWNLKIADLKALDVRQLVLNKDEDFFNANSDISLHLQQFKESILVDGQFLKYEVFYLLTLK